jgi:hypothetical protein
MRELAFEGALNKGKTKEMQQKVLEDVGGKGVREVEVEDDIDGMTLRGD